MEIDVGAARLSTLENGFPDCHPIEENTCPHFLNSCENDLPRALKIFTSFNRFGVIYRLGTTISISLFLETAIRYSSKSKIFLLLGAKRKKGEVKREHGFRFLYPPAHRLLRATTRVTRASRLRSPSVRFIVVSTNTGLFSAVENFSGHERRLSSDHLQDLYITGGICRNQSRWLAPPADRRYELCGIIPFVAWGHVRIGKFERQSWHGKSFVVHKNLKMKRKNITSVGWQILSTLKQRHS